MAFNFMRGRQMIIHDPRLANPYTDPPTPLRPPGAMNVWTVSLTDTAAHIIDHAKHIARGDKDGQVGNSALDALHFMAHGSVGSMQLGTGFNWANVNVFEPLKGLIRGAVVFFSCQVGGEQALHGLSYQMTFGKAVAVYTGCKVVTCKMNQIYSWGADNVIDFGHFEGSVYVYSPDPETGAQLFNHTKDSQFNLERFVFGAAP